MPDEDPAHDPEGDADILHDCEVVEYLINSTLHEKVSAARQEPGILLWSKSTRPHIEHRSSRKPVTLRIILYKKAERVASTKNNRAAAYRIH